MESTVEVHGQEHKGEPVHVYASSGGMKQKCEMSGMNIFDSTTYQFWS